MKTILKCGLVSIILAPLASYDHSSFGRYDTSATMEIEGEVTAISWRNPVHSGLLLWCSVKVVV